MKVGDYYRCREIEYPADAPEGPDGRTKGTETETIRRADGPESEPWTFGRFVTYAQTYRKHPDIAAYQGIPHIDTLPIVDMRSGCAVLLNAAPAPQKGA